MHTKFLILFMVFAAASQAQTDIVDNLGIEMSGPYYKRRQTQPYAGFTVNLKTFRDSIRKHVRGDTSVSDLNKLLDIKNISESVRYWHLCTKTGLCNLRGLWLSVNEEDDTATLVMSDGDKIPTFDVSDIFEASFSLSTYEESLQVPCDKDVTLKHGDPAKSTSECLKLGGRSFELTTDLARTTTDLVTVEALPKDGKYVHNKADAAIIKLNSEDPIVTRIAGVKPLFGGPVSVKFAATLSELSLDSRTNISVGFGEIMRAVNFENSVNFVQVLYRTTQSFHRMEVGLDTGMRWGDRRGEDPLIDSPENYSGQFFTGDESNHQVTFDTGLETSYWAPGLTRDVAFKSGPSDPDPARLGFRPYVQVNFNKLYPHKSDKKWFLEGSVRELYLDPHYSGTSTEDRLVTVGELNLGFKKGGAKFGFSLTFGTNPANGYSRVYPTYGIGIKNKF